MGAAGGAGAAEVLELVRSALAEVPGGRVTVLATVDGRAGHGGVAGAARELGVPLRDFPSAVLAAVPVPTPSEAVRAATGTPSVAEAAALTAAGPGGGLVVPKRKSAHVTVALARCGPELQREQDVDVHEDGFDGERGGFGAGQDDGYGPPGARPGSAARSLPPVGPRATGAAAGQPGGTLPAGPGALSRPDDPAKPSLPRRRRARAACAGRPVPAPRRAPPPRTRAAPSSAARTSSPPATRPRTGPTPPSPSSRPAPALRPLPRAGLPHLGLARARLPRPGLPRGGAAPPAPALPRRRRPPRPNPPNPPEPPGSRSPAVATPGTPVTATRTGGVPAPSPRPPPAPAATTCATTATRRSAPAWSTSP
nr:cobalamin biosynthesis protein [Actinacidiphila yeochonensis]